MLHSPLAHRAEPALGTTTGSVALSMHRSPSPRHDHVTGASGSRPAAKRPKYLGDQTPAGKPLPTSAGVSARMSRQRTRDTGPELAIRRGLFAAGLRYRVAYPVPKLPRCSIDIAFPRQKVAVLVDGCFWHGCPQHGTIPRTNTTWWTTKLEANIARDRRVHDALTSAGWTVLRIWEHEEPAVAIERTVGLLAEIRSTSTVTT